MMLNKKRNNEMEMISRRCFRGREKKTILRVMKKKKKLHLFTKIYRGILLTRGFSV